MSEFRPGQLWRQVCQRTAEALASGHLLPIKTSSRIIRDADMDFVVRLVDSLSRKPSRGATLPAANPFLPCDPHLVVGDISSTHIAVLNKFMVVDHHLLIVTRDFVCQEASLQLRDFAALGRCLFEYDSVGFYNSGTVAGASQPHRHLQLIPLPLDQRIEGIPTEGKLGVESAAPGQALQSDRLPFAHRWWRFRASVSDDSCASFAQACNEAYQALVAAVGWSGVTRDTPYNLAVTRRWMMLVPRRAECFEGISLNALAYLGALLVSDDQQLKRIREAGPMTALQSAAA